MSFHPPPNPPEYPQAPPPGYGGVPATRQLPAQVNTAAILLFVAGGFGILGGLLFLLVGSLGAIFVFVGLVLLVLGGFEIWVGVALRQLKEWARMAAIALAAIGALLSLISLFKGSYTSVVSIILDGVVIYLLTQQEAVRAFATPGR